MKKVMGEILGLVGLAVIFALPILDFVLVIYLVYIATVPDLFPPIIAILLGCIISVIAQVMLVASQGRTVMEVNIGAFMLFVLILIAYPAARRAPAIRRANLHRHALPVQREHVLRGPQTHSPSVGQAK